ncbi:MAG: phosphorylase family protein [Acidobacteriaceae bacterium]
MNSRATQPRIAILAALPREVAPLVRNWPVRTISRGEGTSVWECDRAIVVCAGMGRERVTRAFELAESRGALHLVLSVGYAGALRTGMPTDTVYWPSTVIDGQTGERFTCSDGAGTLVTTDHEVGREEKLTLAARWNADLVDMESATVARLAKLRSLPFRALRAVSDSVDDNLPDFSRFADERGGFRSGLFAIYAALRPWSVPTVLRLGKQSARASQAIARALQQIFQQAE